MRAKVLMIQGTTSNAGKSAMVTGLCKTLVNFGLNVAPFKPQNMSLNSAVTLDGKEIGRAQALQAMACGIEPHSDMNPVLLKPSSDTGSQVIVQGKVYEAMIDASSYHNLKAKLIPYVLESFYNLAQKYDVIIVEGAGSPAEINLAQNDLANMGFAKQVNCPVIIVSDIERGGVFAHLYGTWALLTKNEKKLVKGFIINKFRGDKQLLNTGIDYLYQQTNIPLIGIMPYINNLQLQAEDSLSHELPNNLTSKHNKFKITILKIPYISNETDFEPLFLCPNLEVSYAQSAELFPKSDLIIIPGSKNVREALKFIIKNSWDTEIFRHLRYGGKLIGICGGLQILGKVIHDPWGIEGDRGSSQGLGLLELETTITKNKQLKLVEGYLAYNKAFVRGYEIHMGVSTGNALVNPAIISQNQKEGAVSKDNLILGTYLHGLFDENSSLQAIMQWAGLNNLSHFDYKSNTRNEINKIAANMECNLDMLQLMEILNSSKLNFPINKSKKMSV